ncbi:subtilisin-like protein [Sarocladium strictum]
MRLSSPTILTVLGPFFALVCAAPSGPSNLVKLSIALAPADSTLLERTLYEVSDPLSPRYGQHLSRDEAHALVAPRADSAGIVKRWLTDIGAPADRIHHEGRWIEAHVPAEHAKRFSGGESEVNAKRSLPDAVGEHISLVHRSSGFENAGDPRQSLNRRNIQTRAAAALGPGLQSRKPDLNNCHLVAGPACMREWYKIPVKKEKPSKGNLLGIVGFLGQTAQHEQLEEFQKRFDPFSTGGNFTSQGINGGVNPQETPEQQYASGEANGNAQYTVALTYDIPVRFYPVGGLKTDYVPDLDFTADVDNEGYGIEPFLELAKGLMALSDKDLPLVVSMSWSSNEQHFQKQYAKETCNLFGQLGTRGVSILSSAGNLGPGGSCQSNDGKKRTKFMPAFPASCPYVTSVGGTTLTSNTSAGGRSGKSVAIDFGGGGFSDVFDRPQWQDKAVKAYLKKHGDKWKKYYNQNGRGYPDVAAHAGPANVPTMNHGDEQYIGGTSVATPVFASLISRINNQRLKDKKPPMGFLNPFLWKVGDKAFTDITSGKSVGCTGESVEGLPSPEIPGAGWEAVKGWDPITGWGTPRFDKLKKEACD